MTKIQMTVSQLEMMASATRLASFLINEGVVRHAIVIPPASLSKGTWNRTNTGDNGRHNLDGRAFGNNGAKPAKPASGGKS